MQMEQSSTYSRAAANKIASSLKSSSVANKLVGSIQSSRPAPVGIFQGYDTVNDTGLSMALTGEIEMSGGYSRVSYQVCYGIEALSEAMGVSGSLAASFGLMNAGSISVKLKFINSLKLTTHSTCIVVSAKHGMGKETATNWRLKPDIKPPKGNSELLDFFRVYGDSFLAARTKGGEYFAVYTFYAESQERKSELTAELRAKGLFSIVSVDASVQARLSKMSSTEKTRVSLDQTIYGMANPQFPGADGIIKFALDFPSLQLTSPVFIDLQTTGYERVPGIGTNFDAISDNRKLFVGLEPKLVMLKQLQHDISDISDIYRFYGGYAADTKLVQVKREADADAKVVEDLIAAYEANPTQKLKLPGLPSLSYGTPSLRYEIQRTQRYLGEADVEPFDDIDRRAYLQQKTRISALQFRLCKYDDFKRVISYFKVIYTNSQGSHVIAHGSSNLGQLTDEILLSSERVAITAVSGNIACNSYGSFWRSIGFDLSDDRQVYFSRNYPEGQRWEVPKGWFLLGFSGRFGSYLVELQCVYASFRPAAWT